MDFLVKQINITSVKQHYNKPEVDVSHGFILIVALVLLTFFNTTSNVKTGQGFWTLPVLSRINIYIIITTILPVISILVTIFYVYKMGISVILHIRYGNQFKGLLNGPDTLWTLPDNSNGIVNIFMVIRHRNIELFQRQIIRELRKIGNDPLHWKLQCKHSSFMGFTYLLSHGTKKLDSNVLRPLDGALFANHDKLQATLSKLVSSTIPGGYLWEVYIGSEEISWAGSENTNHRCFPLIVRFHHALGDGLALLQLVQRCFSTRNVSKSLIIPTDRRETGRDTRNECIQEMVRITIYLMHTALLFYKLPEMILRVWRKQIDCNCLHGGALSGAKVVAWRVENGYKYVNRVKGIKRRLKSAAFMDVISASVGYALDKFYKQKGCHIHHVNAVIPAIAHDANFTNMNTSTQCTLTNRFSVGVLELPIDVTSDDTTITNFEVMNANANYWRCAQTMANLFDLRTSYEFQLNHWLLNLLMSLTPRPLIRYLLKTPLALSTLVLSNLPGPRRIYLDLDNYIEDIVFWVPHRGLTGVSISIFTYDDRFQLGISIDKVFKVTSKEAEKILESMFDYIDHFYDELMVA